MDLEKQVLDMQFGKNNSTFVAIWMVTYNHELYIKQAIQSILMQKTSFRYKLFIGEDFSTDSTREICIQYAKEFPGKIELILQEKNIGAILNASSVYKACFESNAKYIAMCEGDDYWTDEYKLQKQVDVLEAEPYLSSCFHGVEVKNEIPNITYEYPIPQKIILNFNDIFRRHYIATCSLLFRSSFLPNPLPDWFTKSKIGDIPLELILADKGDFRYIDEKMACYRRNINSLTSSKKQIEDGRKIFIYVYKNLNKQLSYKYWHLFGWKLGRLYLGYIKDFFQTIKYYLICFSSLSISFRLF